MTEASGINNAGEIVGTYVDAGGRQHGFLATPTPEPSTLLLLSAGTLPVIGWSRRRHLHTAQLARSPERD
jgi:probable HAF family extracellular repeat protein